MIYFSKCKQKIFSAGQKGDFPFVAKFWDLLEEQRLNFKLTDISLYFLFQYVILLTTLGGVCSPSFQCLCSFWAFCTVNQVPNSFLVFMQRTGQTISPTQIVTFSAFYRQKGKYRHNACHHAVINARLLISHLMP